MEQKKAAEGDCGYCWKLGAMGPHLEVNSYEGG